MSTRQEELYSKILEISEDFIETPDFYTLLGIERFESRGDVIHAAALRQNQKLLDWQLNDDLEFQKARVEIQKEVNQAYATLVNAAKKGVYDRELALELGLDMDEDSIYGLLSNDESLTACPVCECPIAADAVLCVQCGYDLESQTLLTTIVGASATTSGNDPSESDSGDQSRIGTLFQFLLEFFQPLWGSIKILLNILLFSLPLISYVLLDDSLLEYIGRGAITLLTMLYWGVLSVFITVKLISSE